MANTHTIHSSLGRIAGSVHKNVVQYRGIPYARIPGRFKDPIGPIDALGEFDATKWGPMATQPANCEEIDSGFFNTPLEPMPPHRKQMSELDCANLVVVTPHDEPHEEREQDRLSPTNKLLPVMVWVHPGALRIGSANFPAYDMRDFVAYSVEAGKAVIAVSVNYRLGTLGFLASKEVAATGNYGLKDQVMALKWVKDNIEGFGGDPENITYFGDSAGAVSGSIHLYSTTPLFRRAILLSGLAGAHSPRPLAAQEEIYKQTLSHLHLAGLPVSERVGIFLNTPPAEIANVASSVDISPTSDGAIIPTTDWVFPETFKPLPDWCNSLIIGTCRDEVSVIRTIGGFEKYPQPIRTFHHRLSRVFTAPEAAELLAAFALADTDDDDPETKAAGVQKLYAVVAQYAVHLPAYHFSRHWAASEGKSAFVSHMAAPSPLPGNLKGLAHHGLDMVLALRNVDGHLPEEYRELGRELANGWLRYAYGEEPWAAFRSGEEVVVVRVWDVGGGGGVKGVEEVEEWWGAWQVMLRLGLDKGWGVVREFWADGPKEGDPV